MFSLIINHPIKSLLFTLFALLAWRYFSQNDAVMDQWLDITATSFQNTHERNTEQFHLLDEMSRANHQKLQRLVDELLKQVLEQVNRNK